MNVSALILPIILIIISYFFLIRPQQKRTKERREMINRIEVDQKITIIGGTEGTIKAMDEIAIVVTVNSHGTEMTSEKPVIKQVDPS